MVVEATQLGTFDIDPQSGKMISSRTFNHHLGLPADAEVSYDVFLRALSPEDRPRIDEILHFVFQPESGGQYAAEYRTLGLEDGVERWVSAWGRVTFDSQSRPVRFVGVTLDITERKEAELRVLQLNGALDRWVKELKSALSEKEVLFKELQHRVKNNLQVISSLLALQGEQSADGAARAALAESRDRVRSMAMVYEQLCFSGTMAEIDFAPYLESLARNLFDSYGVDAERIELRMDVQATLALQAAIPCGLILQELLSNSLKHAFPGGLKGAIHVTIRCREEECYLEYGDNGIGLPANLDVYRAQTLGMQLVSDLTLQLGAQLQYSGPPGASFVFRFRCRDGKSAKADAAPGAPRIARVANAADDRVQT